jgi:hypothetical protein
MDDYFDDEDDLYDHGLQYSQLGMPDDSDLYEQSAGGCSR